MTISAKLVNELRGKTGVGIMDCKRALSATCGDVDKAVTYLREKGLAAATRRASRLTREGKVACYVHMGGKIGAMVEVNCETDFVAKCDEFQTFCREVAMQVAASNPTYLNREQVPEDMLAHERDIYRKQALAEGKPENIVDKIVEGRMKKWYAEFCLLDQPYIREQKMSIESLRQELISKIGENIVIQRFARFQLGSE